MPLLPVVLATLVVSAAAGCADDGREVRDDQAAAPSASVDAATASPTSVPTVMPSTQPTSQPSSPAVQEVEVYFNRTDGGAAFCTEVVSVTRQVRETEAVATAALEELFAGPTEQEEQRGLSSFFSGSTRGLLRSVHVEDGTAYLDLGPGLLDLGNASTTCGASALTTSIEQTLRQFPTVDEVRYAVEGEPETFYDFIQVGCPRPRSDGDRCDPEPFSR